MVHVKADGLQITVLAYVATVKTMVFVRILILITVCLCALERWMLVEISEGNPGHLKSGTSSGSPKQHLPVGVKGVEFGDWVSSSGGSSL